jgi:hypothetical protein
LRSQIAALRDHFAFRATEYIVNQAVDFARSHEKKLMFILFDPQATRELIATGARYDQPVVDFLERNGLRYFDMNRVHARDYQSFRLSVDDYLARYLIGHYSPAGNHFFAFALKDALVDWLDPRPITYQGDESQALIDFRGYLPARAARNE